MYLQSTHASVDLQCRALDVMHICQPFRYRGGEDRISGRIALFEHRHWLFERLTSMWTRDEHLRSIRLISSNSLSVPTSSISAWVHSITASSEFACCIPRCPTYSRKLLIGGERSTASNTRVCDQASIPRTSLGRWRSSGRQRPIFGLCTIRHNPNSFR